MHIKEYSYIITIAEEGSLTKAAQKLFISQPALSLYIKGIENQLGFKLYNKLNNKLIFTYEGERFLNYAKEIIQLEDKFFSEIESIRQLKSGRVKLGIASSRSILIFPRLFDRVQ